MDSLTANQRVEPHVCDLAMSTLEDVVHELRQSERDGEARLSCAKSAFELYDTLMARGGDIMTHREESLIAGFRSSINREREERRAGREALLRAL